MIQDVLNSSTTTYHTPGISQRTGSVTTYEHTGLKSNEAQSISNASSGQTIEATRQYDAFGNISASTGSWTGVFGYGGPFGYQETGNHGLRLLGHRYYDSSTGRFLTRDKAKDGGNWYGYCGSDPVGNSDPSGNNFLKDIWGNFSEWWSGTDAEGPNGEPVRIGGWHAFFFNVDGNAMTVNGTVHLNGHSDYEKYINNKWWSDHEVQHINQVDTMFGGSSISFVVYSAALYVGGLGHDGSPLEIDANNAAGAPYTDPFSKGVFPLIKPFWY